MEKEGFLIMFIFLIIISAICWYFISNSPCKPITKCNLPINLSSTDKVCTSDTSCSWGKIRGNCDMNTFKCVNLVLEGNKEECTSIGGEWIEAGCNGGLGK
jgi:hypothetical protein